jgi:hypothetical protein
MSETKVVNVRVKYIRPEYHDLREWCEDDKNVYIGRKGVVFVKNGDTKMRYPPKNSIFANPFKVGKDGDLDEVIQKYKMYILKKIKDKEIKLEDIENLKGKNLGCWCKLPDREVQCHGDVLIELLNAKMK